MYVAGFNLVPDGSGQYVARNPIEQERLSFNDFKQIHGGGPVTNLQDTSRFLNVPWDFQLWKTAAGSYMAVKP
jgi:hypothetical protein